MDVILKLMFAAALYAHVTALITSPPRIVKQPVVEELSFVVASDGEDEKPFVLDCEAEGEPTPFYFWTKNGLPFEYTRYDSRISQQPGGGSLVFRLPSAEDAGQYQCFARNQYGTATSNSVFVRRTVLYPFGDQDTKYIEAVEGEPLKLGCNPPEAWPKPKVVWMQQRNDLQLRSIINTRITWDPEGNLWFSNVTRQDSSSVYAYICMAYLPTFLNSYKTGNKVFLNVTPRLSITEKEPVRQYTTRSNEDALRGGKVELYCIYGGTPRPEVVWKKDGAIISSSYRYNLRNFGRSLVIRRADNEDQGSYTCEVSNGVGADQTHTVHLSIKVAPRFTEEPQILRLQEGETAVIRCRAAGTPDPQMQWLHNGQPLDVAGLLPRRTVSNHSVTIVDLRRSDTGNYGCNASNSFGYVYKDVYINVQSLCNLPPHPSVTYYCKLNDPRVIEGRRLCDELEPSGTEVIPVCNRPNYYERGILTNMHCVHGNWNYIAVCHPECGTPTPNGTELVVRGERAERGELPWHAGVYDTTTTPYMQICGGSLVSTAVVISAAHCFYRRDALRRPSEFAVALGKIYRPWANPRDRGAHMSNVSDIRIPPYYTGAASNHQADIALVFLAAPAQLAVYIRPVCVEFDGVFDARQLQRGRSGKVAGWGLTGADATPSKVLLTVNMPFVDVDTCVADIPYLALDKFCAGDKNGTVLCQGDSGGGLAFPAEERGARRYYLRGVVSTAPSDAHACNLRAYTTFTRIRSHEAFIKQNLNQ